MNIQPIILSGGIGSRLWPLSRSKYPKQFIEIFDKKSLFDLTLERVIHLKSDRDPIIIISKDHKHLVQEKIEKLNIEAKILLEPDSKNTTAAIYLASKFARKDDILLIMPSDHLIYSNDDFLNLIQNSLKSCSLNSWTTFGVKPNNPSTLYGYIKFTDNIKSLNAKHSFHDVTEFIEKPNIQKASEMLLSGQYLWNSGIFMGQAQYILTSIKQHAPEVVIQCEKVFDNATGTSIVSFDSKYYKDIPSISIDYSVIENEINIKCILMKVTWSDLGSWDSFIDLNYNNKKQENIIQLNGDNKIISSKDRTIATVGVKDLIIIDTKDATLITKRNQSENLKKLITENKDLDIFNQHSYDIRPWGSYEILLDSSLCKVKKLNISSKKRLSLQYHNKRSEHWFVLSGEATIHLDGEEFKLEKGKSIDIMRKANHFIGNYTNKPLIIIEVQMGDYFGEDDIIRLDDPYNR